jgi:hypothetical protein
MATVDELVTKIKGRKIAKATVVQESELPYLMPLLQYDFDS